jgi:hypothetical protein
MNSVCVHWYGLVLLLLPLLVLLRLACLMCVRLACMLRRGAEDLLAKALEDTALWIAAAILALMRNDPGTVAADSDSNSWAV